MLIHRHAHAAQRALKLPSLISRSLPFHGKSTVTLERWSFMYLRSTVSPCTRVELASRIGRSLDNG
jgi:hypothetical protein